MNNFWQQLAKPIIALAPMAGVTDAAFRIICKDFGADVIYTEFASTNALAHGNDATRKMIAFDKRERPVVCQLFGNEPEMYRKAASILEEMGFDGVDINFGCPAYKVVAHGGGVSLMRDPKRCAEIVAAACEGVKNIPVSIKIRTSICKENCDRSDPTNHVTALQLIDEIKHLPVAAVMIHGRSYEKPFDGDPNTGVIKQVKRAFNGVVIANGGINTPENAKRMLDETGADGVGLARGVRGSPWLFKQIKDYLATGSYQEYSWEDRKQLALKHSTAALKFKGEWGIVEMRKHLAWYVHGTPHAAKLRSQLVRVNTIKDVETILAE
ncbi:MAG: tRNA-dihydrouridine synthase [Parcubacteria group bacterium]